MDKRNMLEKVINHYSQGNKAQFAARVGITPQALSMWFARGSFDFEAIYNNCENISGDWLLSGEGEMIKDVTVNEGSWTAADDFRDNVKDLKHIQNRNRLLIEENERLRSELNRRNDPELHKKESEVYRLWMEHMRLSEKLMDITDRMRMLYQQERIKG